MVVRACWVWGWRSWEFGVAWWGGEGTEGENEDLDCEERRVRRDGARALVGFLRSEKWAKRGRLVKRVSLEDEKLEGKIVGAGAGELRVSIRRTK
jgi:hypothetical protein